MSHLQERGDTKLIAVQNFWDVTTVAFVSRTLGCSQATTYRTLKRAKVPIYRIPHSRTVLLHNSTLWRLVSTPAFKKFLRRCQLPEINLHISDDEKEKGFISLQMAVEQKLLPLPLEQAVIAAKCGLIPLTNGRLETWFELVLSGDKTLPLPRKK